PEARDRHERKSSEFWLPEPLRHVKDVGMYSDPREGVEYIQDLGKVVQAFAEPEKAKNPRTRQLVLDYLEDDTIPPRLLEDLGNDDPEKASRLMRFVLDDPEFTWSQDAQPMLQYYKRNRPASATLPSVLPLSPELIEGFLYQESLAKD